MAAEGEEAEGAAAEGAATEGVVEPEGTAERAAAQGAAPYVYTAFVNSNRDTVVRHEDPTAIASCL